MSDRSGQDRRWVKAAVLLALLASYGVMLALLAPPEINGDGIGYLKQISAGGIAPGHLAYVPLLRVLAGARASGPPMALTARFTWLSIVVSLAALALLFDASRLLGGRPLATAALLALSYAFLRSAHQVEVYALATSCCVAMLWSLIRFRVHARHQQLWAVLAGLCGAAAFCFHLTLALLGIPLALLLGRWSAPGLRLKHVLVGVGSMGAALALLLVVIAWRRGGLEGAWLFLRSADHGVPGPAHGLLAPLVALWGLGRSLLYVPYPYEASRIAVVGLSACAALAWIILLVAGRRGPRPALEGGAVLAWSMPLALFAVAFYPSDTERWIFVLPALALYLGAASRRVLVPLLAVAAALNLGLGLLPGALAREAVQQAQAADRILPSDALLVSPGNGWDELAGLNRTAPLRRFPLLYRAGAARSLPAAIAAMHREVEGSLRGGRPVFVARLRDRRDPRGFKELGWLGLSAEQFTRLFARYHVRSTSVSGLWQILEAPTQQPR